jgi:hypothetical protein
MTMSLSILYVINKKKINKTFDHLILIVLFLFVV